MGEVIATSLLGAVLCGGRSTRMGRDKSELEHPSGGTFLSFSIDRLARVCDAVCLAGTPVKTYGRKVIPDETAGRGPVGGIAAALAHAGSAGFTGCLVTAVDLPDLTVDDLMQLSRVWRLQPDRLVCARTDTDSRLQPLIAIYPTAFRDRLRRLAESEDRGLQRWLRRQDSITMTLPGAACRNINTPEDLGGESQIRV